MTAKVTRLGPNQDLQAFIRGLERRGAEVIAAVPRGSPVDVIFREAEYRAMEDGPNDLDVLANRSYMAKRELARLYPCPQCDGMGLVAMPGEPNRMQPCNCDGGVAPGAA
jgi:hypothetical protein